jgi:hypothetical protein
VQCLQSKPAKTPSGQAPGAKTRFDDFVALHIQQTLEIHYTGNFLSWHRLYTWLYEEALRSECGYTGTQPVRPPLPAATPHPNRPDGIADSGSCSTGTGASRP